MMASKIDFYILQTADQQQWLMEACRLTEKAYADKRRVYLHADSKTLAHQLDEMLWTYRDTSFLPHNLYGEGPDTPPPIQIGYDAVPAQHRDTLINMSGQLPAFFAQFNRVIELVSSDPVMQAAARERYKQYRSQGYEITTHQPTVLTE